MLGSVPFLSSFRFHHRLVSTCGLILAGLILLFTIPVNVMMGQELAPTQTRHRVRIDDGLCLGHSGLHLHPADGLDLGSFSMQHRFSGWF